MVVQMYAHDLECGPYCRYRQEADIAPMILPCPVDHSYPLVLSMRIHHDSFSHSTVVSFRIRSIFLLFLDPISPQSLIPLPCPVVERWNGGQYSLGKREERDALTDKKRRASYDKHQTSKRSTHRAPSDDTESKGVRRGKSGIKWQVRQHDWAAATFGEMS